MAYIDELSAVSAEAYAFEQSERAGAVDRRRAELLELLLLGKADETALRQAAQLADWTVPAQVVVVTLPLDRAQGLRQRLAPGAIVIERGPYMGFCGRQGSISASRFSASAKSRNWSRNQLICTPAGKVTVKVALSMVPPVWGAW